MENLDKILGLENTEIIKIENGKNIKIHIKEKEKSNPKCIFVTIKGV